MSSSAWYASRAAGLVAYALLWASVIWGIMATAKPFSRRISKAAILDWHRVLSMVAFSFAGFHAVVLLLDSHTKFGLADLLVPFHFSDKPVATAAGVVAFELGLAVAVSIKFRKVIGQKVWRALHFVSYPVFFLALLHFVAIGTDAKHPLVLGIALVSGLTVVFATAFRVIFVADQSGRAEPRQRAERPPRPQVETVSSSTREAVSVESGP